MDGPVYLKLQIVLILKFYKNIGNFGHENTNICIPYKTNIIIF